MISITTFFTLKSKKQDNYLLFQSKIIIFAAHFDIKQIADGQTI